MKKSIFIIVAVFAAILGAYLLSYPPKSQSKNLPEPTYKIINGTSTKCKPEAYYGRSDKVTMPNCGPKDPRCTVDPCR